MAVKLTLWHNPRCSKSRAALALLQERGITPGIRLYLSEPPTVEELEILRRQLNAPVITFTRTGESIFKELGLTRTSTDASLIAVIVRHPILLERPIFVARDKAVVGRPPEAVLSLL